MPNPKLSVKSQFLDNAYFSYPFMFFLIIGLILQIFTNKGDITLFVNSFQNPILDKYFIFMTEIGDGTYFGIALIFVLLYKVRFALLGVATYLASGAIVQILKYFIEAPRPKIYFEGTGLLNFINGVNVHSYNSFPSGHTASGFAIFLFLAILTKNKHLGFLYFMIALSVGISRVYLLQHFFIDIYFGAIFGFVFTILVYNIIENNDRIANSKWYNYSIINKYRK